MDSKLKIESRKSQLLYKLFLRGCKNNTTTPGLTNHDTNPIACLAFNKLTHHPHNLNYSRLDKEQQQELRYTKRQRQPDDEIPSPTPASIEIVELTPNMDTAQKNKVTEKTDNHLLNLKWTCETLDKRREQITRYFQNQILKQKVEATEPSPPQYDHPEIVPPPVHYSDDTNYNEDSGSNSPTEPIYAEICSGHQHASSISSFDQSFEDYEEEDSEFHPQDTPEEHQISEEDIEHLYENIDIIRHELTLLKDKELHPPPSCTTTTEKEEKVTGVNLSLTDEAIPPPPEKHPSKTQRSGDIDEESILENKPAIKHYWESKMKESAASQFARSNFGVPSSTIIDKINDEIRDDYMRNLELLQDEKDEGLPRSSASDTSDEPIEFDSFDMASSSNNSSPFGGPHDTSSPLLLPESPTLIDSGHQSQESHSADHDEDEVDHHHHHDIKEDSPPPLHNTFNGTSNSINNVNSAPQKKPLSHSYSYGSYTGIPKLGQNTTTQPGKPVKMVPSVGGYRSIVDANRQTSPNHGKIENSLTHYITFNKPLSIKVKPIDDPSPTPPVSLEREKSPPTAKVQQKEVGEDKSLSLSLKPTSQQETPLTSTLKSQGKADISYLLATSRLKKEIEDNLKREKELKDQGRVRTLSVDTVQSTPILSSHELSQSVESLSQIETGFVQHQKRAQFEREKRSEEPPKTNYKKKVEESKQKPPVVATPIVPLPKQSSPAKEVVVPSVTTETKQPVQPLTVDTSVANANAGSSGTSKQLTPTTPNFKIGKNFNSLERYIMYSSMTKLNFRSMPPAWTNTTNGGTSPNPDTNANLEEAHTNGTGEGNSANRNKNLQLTTEEEQEEEPEPTEKVRKHYVPAEKRIKEELLEMVQREEELKQTRQQWKSTPNLSNLNLSDDEEEGRTEETASTVQRRQQQAPRWGVEKRRRSALITKWEDMIIQNSQKNPQ